MNIALRYGLIYSGINIFFSLIMFVTDLNRAGLDWLNSLVGLIIPVVCIYLAVKEYKAGVEGGYMKFSEVFKKGILICLVGGVIVAGYLVLYTSVIDPDFMDFMMQQQVEKMQEQGMSEDMIEMAINQSAKFQTPFWMFTWGLLGSLIMGSIVSLIMAAVLKKNNPDVFA